LDVLGMTFEPGFDTQHSVFNDRHLGLNIGKPGILLRAPSWKGTLHSAAVKTTTPTRTLVGAPNLIHIEEGCHPVTHPMEQTLNAAIR
jgi:hypothetical protein